MSTDSELLSWLSAGAPAPLSAEERTARRRRDFVFRFIEAISPVDDLGETHELHEAAVARNVFAVHLDLNALGEEEYSLVWQQIDASSRRAIKAYVAIAAKAIS